MTIAIEQLIKMHDPRCMSIESLNVGRGQGILSKDQIVGAFASAQHQHAVGFDLLMAKYRHDIQAEQRIRVAIAVWVRNKSSRPLSMQVCQLSLLMVLERNLPAQIDDVVKLLRRYSAKAGQTRKNTDGLRTEIKQLERQRCRDRATDEEYQRVGEQIEDLAARIEAERAVLRNWSQQHAIHSNVCPRCNGTGKTLRPAIAICNECGGGGRITATFEHLRKSLAITGAVIPVGEWPQYLGLVKQCMRWLYIEESAATRVLGKQFHSEIEA